MLHEDNIRKGFFERHEFEAVCTFLPESYADIANFAYITGWRSAEIKDLQFRNLDFEAGEVRLALTCSGTSETVRLFRWDVSIRLGRQPVEKRACR